MKVLVLLAMKNTNLYCFEAQIHQCKQFYMLFRNIIL